MFGITQASGNKGFVRYLKNTSWMMAERLLRIISGLLVGLWIARFLGPEQFGILSYVLAFAALFGGISKLGLDGIVVRSLVNYPDKHASYLGTAFWLKICGSLGAMALMLAILPFTSNDARTNVFILIIAAGMVFQSFEVVDFYFQSQVRARTVSICKATQLAISSCAKIYMVISSAELLYFVVIVFFDCFVLALCYVLAFKHSNNRMFYAHFDLGTARELLRASWPLMFSAIVVTVYMKIDQIMVKEILGEYEVGIYSAAVKLSEVFYFLPVIVCSSLFPAIIEAKQRGDKIYLERLEKLYKLMFWLALAIALPMSIAGEDLVVMLFGEEFAEAGPVFAIHIWASIFVLKSLKNYI